jgi:Family of unknown function (DUF6338)
VPGRPRVNLVYGLYCTKQSRAGPGAPFSSVVAANSHGISFASSDASVGDLYLQQQWVAEHDWFARPYPTSRGVWLRGSQIVSVEFFTGTPPEPTRSGEDPDASP